MIKKLKYYVQFPTNSVTLQQDLSFEPGITAFTGENGSGKTFGSIEMIRYMLFGKKALRGPAADYKTLDAEMTFEILGSPFTVKRNRKREELADADGNVLAVGAEAVNQRITEELGFSLDVFDLACAALQKQSDRLSQMGSAARKRLIDEIVGLTANEAVEKECREEAKISEREAEAMRSALYEPIAPTVPTGYRPSQDVEADLSLLTSELQKRAALTKAAVKPPIPAAPAQPRPDEAEVSALRQLEGERLRIERADREARAELSRLSPEAYTEAELLDEEQWLKYKDELQRRGPEPTLALSYLREMQAVHAHRALLAEDHNQEVECPGCGHRFHTAGEIPDMPEFSVAEIERQIAAHDRWSEPLPVLTTKPIGLTWSELFDHRARLGNNQRIEALMEMLDGDRLADHSAELQSLEVQCREWDNYQAAMARLEPEIEAAEKAAAELSALPPLKDNTEALNNELVQAKVYEQAASSYEKARVAYDETSAKVSAKSKRANNFKEGAKALAETRKTLKSFLAPSLSRVASALIGDMTGGALTSVIVDEDMNIVVNGQDIATLNGAGSTAANLALRLALGHVLVRERFPVFIADEADSDMSAVRAQYTMDCLASLKDSLKQIFIITHKSADFADHLIEMS